MGLPATLATLDDRKVALIKRTIARGASDDELQLFLHICERSGLDPLAKQIYWIKRGNSASIQTGIDGFRAIAERTGRYAPGREPSYRYADGSLDTLLEATAYVKKMTADGTWHEVAASARWDEYAQQSSQFWQKMPHVMLAKVAESLALRRAFPHELSGLYTHEEMAQAATTTSATETFGPVPRKSTLPAPEAAAHTPEPVAAMIENFPPAAIEEAHAILDEMATVDLAAELRAQDEKDAQEYELRRKPVTEQELTDIFGPAQVVAERTYPDAISEGKARRVFALIRDAVEGDEAMTRTVVTQIELELERRIERHRIQDIPWRGTLYNEVCTDWIPKAVKWAKDHTRVSA